MLLWRYSMYGFEGSFIVEREVDDMSSSWLEYRVEETCSSDARWEYSFPKFGWFLPFLSHGLRLGIGCITVDVVIIVGFDAVNGLHCITEILHFIDEGEGRWRRHYRGCCSWFLFWPRRCKLQCFDWLLTWWVDL